MKTFALIFSILIAFSFSSLLSQTPSSRVLVIGIDGVRSDALTAANTPNIDALMSAGVYSPDAQNDDITISGPGWSDILCGVRSDKHLVVDNSFSGSNYDDYPSLFQRIENTYSAVNTVSICHWAPINDYIVGTDADVIVNVGADLEVRNAAVNQLGNYDPHAMFIHFDDVDYAGHGYGFSPDVTQYMSAIEQADTHVGAVLAALYARPNYTQEDWIVIVTSDHGGLGYSHGGNSMEERNVSFIASGPSVTPMLVEKTILEVNPPPVNCLGGDGTELYFPTNSNVNVLPNEDLDSVVEQDFSVEIRVRTNETPDVAIIGNKDWDSGYNPGFVFSFEYPNGPAWKVNIADGVTRADANGSAGIDDGKWHTLSATFDLDGLMRLYTDGVFVSEVNISSVGNLNAESGLMIGADLNGAYQYNGSLAEVRIWETLVSDEDIAAWACSSVDSNHPNWSSLASYWKMDDNDDYLSNSSPNNPFLDASVNGAEWQVADSTITYDYSETPRLVDVPVTAMTHLNMDILPEWDLDGISWVGSCAVTEDCYCINDVNGDGVIGVADILLILSEFGCTFGCAADTTSDGSVNVNDLLSILTVFGQVCEI